MRIFYTAVFCVAGYLLSLNKRWVVAYLALAVPTFVLGVICSTQPDMTTLDVVRDFMTITLQTVLIIMVLKFSLLSSTAIELDRVIAGVCGYLILALLFADIYSVIGHFSPEAILYSSGEPVSKTDGSLVYFSLVTLTTLGYGDITPTIPLARILAALEAAIGTLYLAVLIASLMSGLRRRRDD